MIPARNLLVTAIVSLALACFVLVAMFVLAAFAEEPRQIIIASPIKSTVRASWEIGFKDGAECATEYFSMPGASYGTLQACKDKAWRKLEEDMEKAK